MKATAKRTRSLLHTGVIVGMVGTAAIVAACSKSESSDESSDQDIGVSTLTPVANAAEAESPVDAVPSPDGSDIYFIAFSSRPDEDGIGRERMPAIFKAVPGAAPIKLFEGAPLVSPFNITISNDGQTLYIADSAAQTSEDRSDGTVFTMGVSGGQPGILAGTQGIAPAGLDVGPDAIFITGRKDGKAGLFKTALGGGGLTTVAVEGPFVDPGGVTVSRKGEVYVVDTGSATGPQAMASVIHVRPDGSTEVIKDGLSVGHPAGIALVNDESALLVSALDNATGNDRVYRLSVTGGALIEFKTTIGDFSESAGLHRARNVDVFAWADSHANRSGTVYRLTK